MMRCKMRVRVLSSWVLDKPPACALRSCITATHAYTPVTLNNNNSSTCPLWFVPLPPKIGHIPTAALPPSIVRAFVCHMPWPELPSLPLSLLRPPCSDQARNAGRGYFFFFFFGVRGLFRCPSAYSKVITRALQASPPTLLPGLLPWHVRVCEAAYPAGKG
ncbi:hypothetical protein V8C26DRAFT_244024 [Trichoderma gracile]